MKIISAIDIKNNISMLEAINAAEDAYVQLIEGSAVMPVRTITDLGELDPTVFYKPSYSPKDNRIVIKLLSQMKVKTSLTKTTIAGVVILIDSLTNSINALIDGSYLTALRTGASAGLATKLLSNEDSKTLAVFGAGAQAYTQIEAVLAVRDIQKVIIYDVVDIAINNLINHFTSITDITFVKGESLDELKQADIICTVTNSKVPLFKSDMLKEGVHINAYGSFSIDMRELPDDIAVGSRLYVDHKESCFSETGDIIYPVEKGFINEDNYIGEIGELVKNRIEGRKSKIERTIMKSVGVAIQDLTIANCIYDKAIKEGFGTDVNL